MPDVVQKLNPLPLYHVPSECSTSLAKFVLLNPIQAVTDYERLQSHSEIVFLKCIDQVLGLWCQACVKRPLMVNQPQIQRSCCLVYQVTGSNAVSLVLSYQSTLCCEGRRNSSDIYETVFIW